MKNGRMIFLIFIFTLIAGCTQYQSNHNQYSGSYLGLTPPDSIAHIFAPNFINTGMATRDITFSPDSKEIYFCVNIGNHSYSTILFTREINGFWTDPVVAPFAKNLEYMYVEPHFSEDGLKLFFASNQPKNNDLYNPEDTDIWYVNRTDKGWSDPINLGEPVNTEGPEFFPSLTESGNLYFTRDDSKTGASYIYRSKFTGNHFDKPELLPEQINAGRSRYNAFVARDESYLIVPIYGLPDSYGGTDYYISYHNSDDTWTDPIHLGKNINSKSRFEYSASVSPDGKYLFFMSSDREKKQLFSKKVITLTDLLEIHTDTGNGNSNIYWIDASFINQLKRKKSH